MLRRLRVQAAVLDESILFERAADAAGQRSARRFIRAGAEGFDVFRRHVHRAFQQERARAFPHGGANMPRARTGINGLHSLHNCFPLSFHRADHHALDEIPLQERIYQQHRNGRYQDCSIFDGYTQVFHIICCAYAEEELGLLGALDAGEKEG